MGRYGRKTRKRSLIAFERSYFAVRSVWETAGMVAFLLALDYSIGDGDRFLSTNPHPFWIPILLVTVQYGSAEGILAAAIATTALLTDNLPVYAAGDDYYSYWWRIVIVPLQWLLTALVLGEITNRHRTLHESAVAELLTSRRRETKFTRAYKELEISRQRLEERLAGLVATPSVILEFAARVDPLDRKSLTVRLCEAVELIIRPKKYSLYQLKSETLLLVTAKGWLTVDEYPLQIDKETPLYQALVVERRDLVVCDAESANTLGSQGIMASPIVEPQGNRVVGILKIEELPWQELSVSSVQSFKYLAAWAGTLYGISTRALKKGVIVPKGRSRAKRTSVSDPMDAPFVPQSIFKGPE